MNSTPANRHPGAPLVSVVIPAYNASRTLRAACDSLRAQTLADWRCTIVDDGSTDDTADLARAIARDDPRFRIVHQANRGLAGARNTGLAHCTGTYVYFLDADDLALPDALRTLAGACASTGAAYAGIEFRDDAGRVLDRTPEEPRPAVGLHDLLGGNPMVVHAQMLRRDLLAHERFDERLRVGEDYDLWLRLAARGVRWAGVPPVVAIYRLRPASLSRDFGAMLRAGCGTLSRAYARMREDGAAPDVDASPARERRVRERLARDYATMRALAGDPHAAAAMLRDAEDGPPTPLSPADAAESLYWGVLYGLCEPPRIHARAPAWWARAEAWWGACVRAGLLDPRRLADVRRAALERLLDPDAIAERLLRDAAPDRRITIVGLGRNGRRVAALALREGLRVAARDDTPDPAAVADPAFAEGITFEPMGAPVHGPCVVTPLRDDSLAARFPGALRWRVAREALTRDLLGTLSRRGVAA